MRLTSVTFAALILLASGVGPALAGEPLLQVTHAWTPAQPEAGGDTPLFLTIANPGSDDTLVRTRCPVANFVELRVLDRGEGVPSQRVVKRIAVPAGESLALAPDGGRIMLLQITEALQPGAKFSCQITFMNAGPVDVDVEVRAGASKSTPPS